MLSLYAIWSEVDRLGAAKGCGKGWRAGLSDRNWGAGDKSAWRRCPLCGNQLRESMGHPNGGP
ncbi:hypothetical protein I41_42600 [Lacipirellula limnantheis]|uniref:Uncharacterized protein n=1 Tax=Lacipirellula limnantheis TaxID=2528024 RepID=A0A517U360_9BACT|nr:hypothetical protein I41_42600 [Lacipirellula limnantheis]